MATAEILSIGTELLLGQVLDTNAQFLSIELAKLGIDCFFRTTVGDNKERIKECVKLAFTRADIIISSGGLGPTADDLTHESIAEALDTPLLFDESIFKHITSLFAAHRHRMPESNRKQAFRPSGAMVLPNSAGTAPGIIWQIDADLSHRIGANGSKLIITFPGVPLELKRMWSETAAPFLAKAYPTSTLWSCELKHYGIGESALAEKFAHLLILENPTVAPYAGHGECRLRVSAKARTVTEAMELARPVIDEIRKTSGNLCYGIDEASLESEVGLLLTKSGKTLAVAESCTGGLLSTRLTDISGSSNYIKLNVISYANEAKMQLLDVSPETLAAHGAVSTQCAEQMAYGIKKLANADLGLSVTGIAGPTGGTAEKPVGLVYLALASGGPCTTKELRLPDRFSREEIRYRAASEALNMVRIFLLEAAAP